MNQLGSPRLLAIVAHPDDESFGLGGTLAKYAHGGVEVHVCTVTDGAVGSSEAPSPDAALSLAAVRRQELECACRVLGVRLHTLDYRDSGMAGISDNQHPDSLYQADLEDVAQDVMGIIRAVRPHVIITHDPTGGYFHPDHIKVCHAVRQAWATMDDAPAYRESGGGIRGLWQPARLYYAVFPRSALKWFVRILRLLRRDPRRFGQNHDIDLTTMGVPDDEIHVRLDVGPYSSIKRQASACHKSQGGGGAPRLIPGLLRDRFFRYEYFVQAQPPGSRAHRDLFEGVVVE
jgi:LmbE family N-acetylglucosaminyl deacetylase